MENIEKTLNEELRNNDCIENLVNAIDSQKSIYDAFVVDGKLVVVFNDELETNEVEKMQTMLKRMDGCGEVFSDEFELGYKENFKSLTLDLLTDNVSIGKFEQGGKVDWRELEDTLKRIKQENPSKKVGYSFIADAPKGYRISINGKYRDEQGNYHAQGGDVESEKHEHLSGIAYFVLFDDVQDEDEFQKLTENVLTKQEFEQAKYSDQIREFDFDIHIEAKSWNIIPAIYDQMEKEGKERGQIIGYDIVNQSNTHKRFTSDLPYDEDYENEDYEYAKGGGVGRIVMIPTYVVKEINDSVKMGYDTIVEGMIGRKRKGVMLINDKYEVRGTYDISLKDAIQNIIDKIKLGTFKVDAVDSKEDKYAKVVS